MSRAWTTAADVARKVQQRWDDGSLLRHLAQDEPFPVVDLPVRGPAVSQLGDELDAVRRWIAELERGSGGGRRFELVWQEVGGRHYGRNRLPSRARVTTYDQAWALLGVGDRVTAYRRMLETGPGVARAWAVGHPVRALALADEWDRLLAASAWLDGHRGSGRFLREITAPGVDTKFVERHRVVLAEILGAERTAGGFITSLGLRRKPELVRLRAAAGVLELPAPLSEGTFRLDELALLPAQVRTVLIVENETTFLALPVPVDGIVLWGKGFEVGRTSALPWLREADVHYWGDLDTHGFAILSLLRAGVPHARSLLMDRQTLLRHRHAWVREPQPTGARLLGLTADEQQLYADLVSDALGESVRLEQECIDWAWVLERLPCS